MTKREAAVIAAYTGILIGEFSAMHEYIEEVMGRPVYTHELGNEEFTKGELREKVYPEFMEIHKSVR